MQILDVFISNFPLIIVLAGLIVSYTTLKTQNMNQERRLSSLESKVEGLNPIFLQIQKDLVGIQTTLKFVEQKIDHLDNHIKSNI